jgi:hypothetical protein
MLSMAEERRALPIVRHAVTTVLKLILILCVGCPAKRWRTLPLSLTPADLCINREGESVAGGRGGGGEVEGINQNSHL